MWKSNAWKATGTVSATLFSVRSRRSFPKRILPKSFTFQSIALPRNSMVRCAMRTSAFCTTLPAKRKPTTPRLSRKTWKPTARNCASVSTIRTLASPTDTRPHFASSTRIRSIWFRNRIQPGDAHPFESRRRGAAPRRIPAGIVFSKFKRKDSSMGEPFFLVLRFYLERSTSLA